MMKTRTFRISFRDGRTVELKLLAYDYARTGNQVQFIDCDGELLLCIGFKSDIESVEEVEVEEVEVERRKDYELEDRRIDLDL